MNGLILAEEVINTNWQDIVVTVLVAVLSSTGLWGYLERKRKSTIEKIEKDQDETTNIKSLIIALAKQQVQHACCIYIARQSITNYEADALLSIYEYYKSLGGNGSTEALINQTLALPRVTEADMSHFQTVGGNHE